MPVDNPSFFATLRIGALALVGVHCERDVEGEQACTLCLQFFAEGHFDPSASWFAAWRRPFAVVGKPRLRLHRMAGAFFRIRDMDELAEHKSVWD